MNVSAKAFVPGGGLANLGASASPAAPATAATTPITATGDANAAAPAAQPPAAEQTATPASSELPPDPAIVTSSSTAAAHPEGVTGAGAPPTDGTAPSAATTTEGAAVTATPPAGTPTQQPQQPNTANIPPAAPLVQQQQFTVQGQQQQPQQQQQSFQGQQQQWGAQEQHWYNVQQQQVMQQQQQWAAPAYGYTMGYEDPNNAAAYGMQMAYGVQMVQPVQAQGVMMQPAAAGNNYGNHPGPSSRRTPAQAAAEGNRTNTRVMLGAGGTAGGQIAQTLTAEYEPVGAPPSFTDAVTNRGGTIRTQPIEVSVGLNNQVSQTPAATAGDAQKEKTADEMRDTLVQMLTEAENAQAESIIDSKLENIRQFMESTGGANGASSVAATALDAFLQVDDQVLECMQNLVDNNDLSCVGFTNGIGPFWSVFDPETAVHLAAIILSTIFPDEFVIDKQKNAFMRKINKLSNHKRSEVEETISKEVNDRTGRGGRPCNITIEDVEKEINQPGLNNTQAAQLLNAASQPSNNRGGASFLAGKRFDNTSYITELILRLPNKSLGLLEQKTIDIVTKFIIPVLYPTQFGINTPHAATQAATMAVLVEHFKKAWLNLWRAQVSPEAIVAAYEPVAEKKRSRRQNKREAARDAAVSVSTAAEEDSPEGSAATENIPTAATTTDNSISTDNIDMDLFCADMQDACRYSVLMLFMYTRASFMSPNFVAERLTDLQNYIQGKENEKEATAFLRCGLPLIVMSYLARNVLTEATARTPHYSQDLSVVSTNQELQAKEAKTNTVIEDSAIVSSTTVDAHSGGGSSSVSGPCNLAERWADEKTLTANHSPAAENERSEIQKVIEVKLEFAITFPTMVLHFLSLPARTPMAIRLPGGPAPITEKTAAAAQTTGNNAVVAATSAETPADDATPPAAPAAGALLAPPTDAKKPTAPSVVSDDKILINTPFSQDSMLLLSVIGDVLVALQGAEEEKENNIEEVRNVITEQLTKIGKDQDEFANKKASEAANASDVAPHVAFAKALSTLSLEERQAHISAVVKALMTRKAPLGHAIAPITNAERMSSVGAGNWSAAVAHYLNMVVPTLQALSTDDDDDEEDTEETDMPDKEKAPADDEATKEAKAAKKAARRLELTKEREEMIALLTAEVLRHDSSVDGELSRDLHILMHQHREAAAAMRSVVASLPATPAGKKGSKKTEKSDVPKSAVDTATVANPSLLAGIPRPYEQYQKLQGGRVLAELERGRIEFDQQLQRATEQANERAVAAAAAAAAKAAQVQVGVGTDEIKEKRVVRQQLSAAEIRAQVMISKSDPADGAAAPAEPVTTPPNSKSAEVQNLINKYPTNFQATYALHTSDSSGARRLDFNSHDSLQISINSTKLFEKDQTLFYDFVNRCPLPDDTPANNASGEDGASADGETNANVVTHFPCLEAQDRFENGDFVRAMITNARPTSVAAGPAGNDEGPSSWSAKLKQSTFTALDKALVNDVQDVSDLREKLQFALKTLIHSSYETTPRHMYLIMDALFHLFNCVSPILRTRQFCIENGTEDQFKQIVDASVIAMAQKQQRIIECQILFPVDENGKSLNTPQLQELLELCYKLLNVAADDKNNPAAPHDRPAMGFIPSEQRKVLYNMMIQADHLQTLAQRKQKVRADLNAKKAAAANNRNSNTTAIAAAGDNARSALPTTGGGMGSTNPSSMGMFGAGSTEFGGTGAPFASFASMYTGGDAKSATTAGTTTAGSANFLLGGTSTTTGDNRTHLSLGTATAAVNESGTPSILPSSNMGHAFSGAAGGAADDDDEDPLADVNNLKFLEQLQVQADDETSVPNPAPEAPASEGGNGESPSRAAATSSGAGQSTPPFGASTFDLSGSPSQSTGAAALNLGASSAAATTSTTSAGLGGVGADFLSGWRNSSREDLTTGTGSTGSVATPNASLNPFGAATTSSAADAASSSPWGGVGSAGNSSNDVTSAGGAQW